MRTTALVLLALALTCPACGLHDEPEDDEVVVVDGDEEEEEGEEEVVEDNFPVVIEAISSQKNSIGTTELVITMGNESTEVTVDAVRLRIKAYDDFGDQVTGLDDEKGMLVNAGKDIPPEGSVTGTVTMSFYDRATRFEVALEKAVLADGEEVECHQECMKEHDTEE